MLMMLSSVVMLVVLALAPFILPNPMYTHFCDQFTLWTKLHDIDPATDNPLCYCVDNCLANHIEALLLMSGHRTQTDEAFSVYLCSQSCFKPDFSTVPVVSLSESPTYVRFMHDLNLNKPVYLNESQLYTVLADGLVDGPYKELIGILNETMMADRVVAHPNDGPFEMNVTQVDLGDVCFRKILEHAYDYVKVNMQLEKTLYCRKSLHCLDVLLRYIVTHGDDVIPPIRYWNFYACVRHTFLKANPVRNTKITTTTVAPFTTPAPKPVRWYCYTPQTYFFCKWLLN